MQGPACRRRTGRFTPSSLVVLLLLPLTELPLANGSCEFPESWAGEWYQYGKPPMVINATNIGEKTCVEKKQDKYVVHAEAENCYHCMIINGRHENVIQYREAYCSTDQTSLEDMCLMITSDDILYSMFRVNAKPISCPFAGPPFTFSYNRGNGDCSLPVSLAEKCTDESKLLLKYQSCPDVPGTESNVEELQCLAVWNDGRNKYLVGILKRRSAEPTYRCYLYEEKPHHQGKVVYSLAQSGDPTCNGLNTVNEGSPILKFTKADKEHGRCKYPSWVTQHHDWHSLDGTKVYHITNKNATLKVRAQGATGEAVHEEKIVCHNLEKMYQNDNAQGHKVKLIAHVTSGCDIGYVCMIFHRRDGHVIELQQSDQKAVMPDDACSIGDPSMMPYTTLITSFLHQRRCPQPGRYAIMDHSASRGISTLPRRERRDETPARTSKRRTWSEEDEEEEEECRSTSVQIGCSTVEQNEMIISNTCEHEEIEYYCHGSWEEKGTWYTIVSRRTTELTVGLGQTFCFSMRPGGITEKTSPRSSRLKQHEEELLFSRPARVCQRDVTEDSAYRLTSQGVCEDLTRAASSAACAPSLSRSLLALTLGIVVVLTLSSR